MFWERSLRLSSDQSGASREVSQCSTHLAMLQVHEIEFVGLHYPLIENFVSACLGGAELCCPIEESLKTDRVLHLVRREQTPKGVYAEDGGVPGSRLEPS